MADDRPVINSTCPPVTGSTCLTVDVPGGNGKPRNSVTSNWPLEYVMPVGTASSAGGPNGSGPVKSAGGAADGNKTYAAACAMCHAAGVAGAPKAGDKAAWKPRIAQGKDVLYTSAIKGKNLMPPKGGAVSLPDADIKAAVDYLVGLAK